MSSYFGSDHERRVYELLARGCRPYFHAADAGMPVINLLDYCDIADDATRPKVLATVRKSLEFELAVTKEVADPFG